MVREKEKRKEISFIEMCNFLLIFILEKQLQLN